MNEQQKYEISHQREKLLYTRVSMSASDFLTGIMPHVQPDAKMLFQRERANISETHDAFQVHPQIIVDFGVIPRSVKHVLSPITEQEAQQYFDDPNIHADSAKKLYVGKLSPQHIAFYSIMLPRDILHPENQCSLGNVSEEIQSMVCEGNIPNYLVAQDVVARRMMALYAFGQILGRSDAELARNIHDAMITRFNHPDAITQPKLNENVQACVDALYYFLPSNKICSQNFISHTLSLQGIAYANPIGMDLPMRVVQKCIQSTLPHMDAASIVSLNQFQDAIKKQGNLNGLNYSRLVSQKVIQQCIHDACEEWKQAAPPTLKPWIEQVQQHLPNIIQQARTEMMRPEDFRMRQIMLRTTSTHDEHAHSEPYIPTLRSEAGILNRYQYELSYAGYNMQSPTSEKLTAAALEETYDEARRVLGFHNIRRQYLTMAIDLYVKMIDGPNLKTTDQLLPKIHNIFQRAFYDINAKTDTDATPKEVMARMMHAAAAKIEALTGISQNKLPSIEELHANMCVPFLQEDMYLGYVCGDAPVALANEIQARFDAKFLEHVLDDTLVQRNPKLEGTGLLQVYTVWQITKEMQREYAPGSPEYAALAAIREFSVKNIHSRMYDFEDEPFHSDLIAAFEQDSHDDNEIGDDPTK